MYCGYFRSSMFLTVAAFFPNAGDEVSSYSFETMSMKAFFSSSHHQRGASALPCYLFFLFQMLDGLSPVQLSLSQSTQPTESRTFLTLDFLFDSASKGARRGSLTS